MEEALWGMHRIESIYDLQAWDMANGIISTHKLQWVFVNKHSDIWKIKLKT